MFFPNFSSSDDFNTSVAYVILLQFPPSHYLFFNLILLYFCLNLLTCEAFCLEVISSCNLLGSCPVGNCFQRSGFWRLQDGASFPCLAALFHKLHLGLFTGPLVAYIECRWDSGLTPCPSGSWLNAFSDHKTPRTGRLSCGTALLAWHELFSFAWHFGSLNKKCTGSIAFPSRHYYQSYVSLCPCLQHSIT